MALAKKKRRTKQDGPVSPNVALIVFVVLFFLGCVGEGLVIYDFIKKEKNRKDELAKVQPAVDVATKEKDWWKYQYLWLKNTTGLDLDKSSEIDENKELDDGEKN